MGLYPHNIYYYKLALLHKSLSRETMLADDKSGKRNGKKAYRGSSKTLNNERLEFLGDAILDAIAGDIVYRHFPGKREGFLTNTRSKMVQRDMLNRLALEMGINDLLTASDRSHKTHNSYLGGNAFEALVGALYLDRGYDACMYFMKKRILKEMINIDKVAYKVVNFKSKLLEWCQKNHINIEFKVVGEKQLGSSSPSFTTVVVLEGIETCPSEGYTKKESQQLAAKQTLERLKQEAQFIDSVFAAKTQRTKMEEEPVENVPDVDISGDAFSMAADKGGTPADNQTSADNDPAATDNDNAPADNAPVAEGRGRRRERAKASDCSGADIDNGGESADGQQPAEMYTDEPENTAGVVGAADEADEFDLSHITVKTMSEKDIIAAAEEEAYRLNA